MCCSSWGHKESDRTEGLNELNFYLQTSNIHIISVSTFYLGVGRKRTKYIRGLCFRIEPLKKLNLEYLHRVNYPSLLRESPWKLSGQNLSLNTDVSKNISR